MAHSKLLPSLFEPYLPIRRPLPDLVPLPPLHPTIKHSVIQHCSSNIAHRASALYPILHYLNFIPSSIPLNATMLTYLWLLLPMLAQAAHRDPRDHVPHRSLTLDEHASSTASSMAWPPGTATPSALGSPCKRIYFAARPSNDSTTERGERGSAELAYECLNSIPFNQSAAAALLESMRPYLEWQSTTSYIKDPPEKVRASTSTSLSCTDTPL